MLGGGGGGGGGGRRGSGGRKWGEVAAGVVIQSKIG